MDKKIELSYLVVTKNKLSYLKITLEKLIAEKKLDEEILVADGASTDGTKDYLLGLKNSGAIDFLVSEVDFGVAHAMNKLILVAKGTLFMLIADDDAYDYQVLAECKRFMLEHKNIDLVCANGGVLYSASNKNHPGYTIRPLDYAPEFKEWQRSHRPFAFAELGLILRRSSLPVIGLRDLNIRRADAEFSLRLTAGKARIAWYNGYSYVNVLNQQSASKVYAKEMVKDIERLKQFYLGEEPDSFFVKRLKIIGNILRSKFILKKSKSLIAIDQPWSALIIIAENWLARMNSVRKAEFIY